jgi:hypothetical protein
MVTQEGNATLNDWGCASQDLKAAVPFRGTFRYASDAVLLAAIESSTRKPMAMDDLHSLLRSALAMLFPEMGRKLVNLKQGEFSAAMEFWRAWRKNHTAYDVFFEAADHLDYIKVGELIG